MRQHDFSYKLYNSKAWRDCRTAYKASVGGLCERCLRKGLCVPGDEVHHLIKLTEHNVSDPSITLNWSNLELLCKDCHHEEHIDHMRRWRVDEAGHLR